MHAELLRNYLMVRLLIVVTTITIFPLYKNLHPLKCLRMPLFHSLNYIVLPHKDFIKLSQLTIRYSVYYLHNLEYMYILTANQQNQIETLFTCRINIVRTDFVQCQGSL